MPVVRTLDQESRHPVGEEPPETSLEYPLRTPSRESGAYDLIGSQRESGRAHLASGIQLRFGRRLVAPPAAVVSWLRREVKSRDPSPHDEMIERRRQYIRERERIVALHRPDGREKHFLLRPLDGRESRRSASPVYEKEGRAVVAALREQQYVRTVEGRACRYVIERMGENSIERKPPPTGFRPSLHARLRHEPESPGSEYALPRPAEICPAVGLAQ